MKNRTALRTIAVLLILCLLPAGFSRSACAATVTIPKKLKTVPQGMFEGDASVTELVIQEGTEAVEAGAFAGTQIKKITLPASLPVDAVWENAFGDCEFQTVITPKGSQWDLLYQPTAYRALLIGERTFPKSMKLDEAKRNVGDTYLMSTALKKVKGPEDPPYSTDKGASFQVTRKTNLSKSQVKSAIIDTFKDTRDQDLSVFFIATHGDSNGDGDGDLAMSDGTMLSFYTLASWLNRYVKGRVFVILESCGAGSSIYPSYPQGVEGNASQNGTKSGQEDNTEELLSKAIQAFAAVDHGITIEKPDGQKGGVSGNSTGDFKKYGNKFYVLAAAEHEENSHGWESDNPEIRIKQKNGEYKITSYNFFTMWLTEGIYFKGSSRADSDNDGVLTLIELYEDADKTSKEEMFNDEHYPVQHVRYYPGDEHCHDSLFKLK